MMTSITAKVTAVKNWLASQHILADEEWLTGCIEYLTSEGTECLKELNGLAREQWLLNDLKEVSSGCLPRDVAAHRLTTLSGCYVLQVNCAIDVGSPAYQQYQKLKKVNLENIEETTKHEEKINSHRMIKLYMTDGVQDITGIEYRTMRNLTSDITPGSKILLKGPVDCRRGTLLLQEHNIEVLGGEVDDLVSANSLPSVLTRLLGVEDAVTPIERTVQIRTQVTTNIPTSTETVVQQNPTNIRPTVATSVQSNNNTYAERINFDRNVTKDANTNKPVAVVTGVPILDNFDDEIDLDQIAALEEQATLQSNKRPLASDPRRDSVEKKFKENNCIYDTITLENKHTNEVALASTRKNNVIDRSSEFPTDEDLFDDFEDIKTNYPITIPSEPFVYIKTIKQVDSIERVGKIFKIKGQIMKLLSKLSIGKDGWSLKCTLIDGTGAIDADFTSDVLTELVGYSPREMSKLKKEMATNPQVKETVLAALNAAKIKLQVLNCIIELKFADTPRITRLIPFLQEHATKLLDRQVSH